MKLPLSARARESAHLGAPSSYLAGCRMSARIVPHSPLSTLSTQIEHGV